MATGSTPAGHPLCLGGGDDDPNVLALPTLVLNRQWQPVHVTTVVRALVMLWNDTAQVVDPDDYRLMSWEDWISSCPWMNVNRAFARPSRASSSRGDLPGVVSIGCPNTAVTFSRRNVAKRDHYVCQYCGAQAGAEAITIDHVLRARREAYRAGPTVPPLYRLQRRKADRTPEQAGMKLRRPPVRPEWKPLYAAHGVRVESWSRFLTHEPALLHA